MKIKYFGTAYEKGLTLTLSIFDKEGQEVGTGHTMTETGVDSAIYRTENVIDENAILPKGVYVGRIEDTISGTFLGFNTFIWNGVKEVTLETLDKNTWTEQEMMQIRDAFGIDGDKMVAREGQLQKKSEAPYNSIIDTTKI